MKKKYSILLSSILVAVAMAAGLASCIKDDLYGCVDSRGNVCLTVRLDVAATARSSSNPESYQIDSTHVYVFDAGNKFVASAVGGVYNPAEEYEFFFTLKSGDYHFVVWTNPGEIYKTNYTFSECEAQGLIIDQLIYYMDVSAEGCLTQGIPDLLYGTQSQKIISNQNNIVSVEMIQNTYHINVEAVGLPQTDDDFEFTITDNNSHYKFDNTIIPEMDDFTHIRIGKQENDTINVSFNVLGLETERYTPRLMLCNKITSEELFEEGLIETIRSAYEQSGQELDFNKIHTFDIKLFFSTNMDVSVSVNGWEYNRQSGQL